MRLKTVHFTKQLNIGGYAASTWSDAMGWDIHLHESGVVEISKDGQSILVGPSGWGSAERAPEPVSVVAEPSLTVTPALEAAPVLSEAKPVKTKAKSK